MHIPDGYLSPSTCGVLYGLSAAAWYGAAKRLKQALAGRTIPLIAVFAGFSFLVMMFNLPLPGGTTGHAVGVTLAAIVLGPSGSILAISIALALQALLFGDGGITTLGANVFNIAVTGSVVGYLVYRFVSGGSRVESRRRVFAAAIAGYVCVNLSALLTATELGLQPILFHDSHGSPLYAPYPLHIAIPAMMIGHLMVAGLAEAAITAGVVAYLQHSDVALLRTLPPSSAFQVPVAMADSRRIQRRIWIGTVILLLLTPVGILAIGTAWGEWSAEDLANPQMRERIAEAARGVPPPASPPRGLARLSTVWTAPFPAYAPRFIKNPTFGYLMSAMFGVGVLAGGALVTQRIATRRSREQRR